LRQSYGPGQHEITTTPVRAHTVSCMDKSFSALEQEYGKGYFVFVLLDEIATQLLAGKDLKILGSIAAVPPDSSLLLQAPFHQIQRKAGS
jgi:hypothetical protein